VDGPVILQESDVAGTQVDGSTRRCLINLTRDTSSVRKGRAVSSWIPCTLVGEDPSWELGYANFTRGVEPRDAVGNVRDGGNIGPDTCVSVVKPCSLGDVSGSKGTDCSRDTG
jgi:hypothetical protein